MVRTRKGSAKRRAGGGGGGEASRAWNRPRGPKSSSGYMAARAQADEECAAEEEEDTEEEDTEEEDTEEDEEEVVEPLVTPLPRTNAKGKGHIKDTGRKDKGRTERQGAAAAAKKDKRNRLASLEAEIAELAQRDHRAKQGISRETSRATRQKESRPGTRDRVS